MLHGSKEWGWEAVQCAPQQQPAEKYMGEKSVCEEPMGEKSVGKSIWVHGWKVCG